MIALSFVCLARDTGRAVWDLYSDLARVAEPGDQVIWVDDSGGHAETARWLNRFAVMEPWDAQVGRETIVTGTRGTGDAGIATNLGLMRATGAFILVLDGAARLDGEGLSAARRLCRAADVVLCPWDVMDRDVQGAIPGTGLDLAPSLSGLMFRRNLDVAPFRLRCDEGVSGWSALPLLWALLEQERPVATAPRKLGQHPASGPCGPSLFEAAHRLCRQAPQAAPWIIRHLPLWLQGAGSGAVTGLLEAADHWVEGLSVLPDMKGPDIKGPDMKGPDREEPGAELVRALRRGAAAEARTRMRALCLASPPKPVCAAPPRIGTAPIRVSLNGPHTRRTPFAYPALAGLWEERIILCETACEADLAVWAHPIDLLELSRDTARFLERAACPAALISEEPFWDSLFSPDPLAPRVTLRAAHLGGLTVHQVNHHRSPIFEFLRFPYFLLTDTAFVRTYRQLFARNAARSPEDWSAAFARRSGRTVFMAERRPETFHDMALPQGDLIGLCAWRTRLAETYETGVVDRLGASWQGGPTRFDLPDWHRDKISRLDGRAELISALENTHQPTYISEKLFDAFACGARPLYLASPGHRVHDLGLPACAWINLWGLESAAAPSAIDAAPPFAEIATAYFQAQRHLAALFHDETALAQEHQRLAKAVLNEVTRLTDLGPA